MDLFLKFRPNRFDSVLLTLVWYLRPSLTDGEAGVDVPNVDFVWDFKPYNNLASVPTRLPAYIHPSQEVSEEKTGNGGGRGCKSATGDRMIISPLT